jgi:CheY-like chemotaxis protein
MLEQYEMNVLYAQSGKEALDLLDKSAVDLVLMDVMMPEMDGVECMKVLRQQTKFKSLPVIALTAKAMKGDREQCIAAGASDYLCKPVDSDQLLSLMRVWLY